jgi:hypothetical protein
MARRGIGGALLVAALLAVPTARAQGGCAGHPDLVGPCVTIRGRAGLYNGNPTIRIWRVGTTRLLGVSARHCEAPACEPLPAAVRERLGWEHPVFADFTLCPFTRARPGVMQLVCVEAARNVRRGTSH